MRRTTGRHCFPVVVCTFNSVPEEILVEVGFEEEKPFPSGLVVGDCLPGGQLVEMAEGATQVGCGFSGIEAYACSTM